LKSVEQCAACQGCPVRAKFPDTNFIEPQVGNSLRAAIGEFPSESDDETGKPMSGGSGTWLKILYKNAGVNVDDVSIVGTTQCKLPVSLTKDEQFQAIEHCRKSYVQPFLESRPWKRIDIFGDAPLKHIGEKDGGIDRWRGSSIAVGGPEVSGGAPNCIPTFSPAYIMRDQSMVPVVINDLRKTPEVEPEHYNIYPSLEELKAFNYKSFAFDIETNRWNQDEVYMVGLSGRPFEAIVVPFTGDYKEELKRIFLEAEEVIGQNCIQFDLPILARAGIKIRGPRECKVWDIMLMHHLRFPSFPHGLEFIGKQFTSKGAWKYDKVSFETYCARDVDVTFRCFAPLKGLLEQAKVLDIYRYVSWPLAMICKSMTDWGFKRSTSRVKELRLKYFKAIEDEQVNLPEQLRTIHVPKRKRSPAPEGTVNEKGKPVKFVYEETTEEKRPWKSPAVKMKFLYEECGLPPQLHVKKKTPTVDKTALDKLFNRLNNPAQAMLKQFDEARIAELKSVVKSLKDLNQWATRLAGFAKESDVEDDFIHSSFNVHGTETGRLSSSGGDGVAGNMQNIPSEARFMFVPRFDGGRIVACVPPETPVLKADFTWQPIGSLEVGDKLLGFDEHCTESPRGRSGRRIRKSQVTASSRLMKPCYRITTTCGEVISSDCHLWLRKPASKCSGYRWTRTDQLQPGDILQYFIKPWMVEESWHAGWLAGFLDGEGSLSGKAGCRFAQNDGPTLDYALRLIDEAGFGVNIDRSKKAVQVRINGEPQAGARFIGRFRPRRLLAKLLKHYEGKVCNGNTSQPATIETIEFLGMQEVVALETSTHTYFANGFFSHNCDYSGGENRLTAVIANDRRRLKWFESRTFSEHKYLAAQLEGIPYEEVVKSKDKDSWYAIAKVVVHGVDRLMGAKRIWENNDLDPESVKKVHAQWRNQIIDTVHWQRRASDEAKRQGWACNAFGRKLWFWESNAATRAISFFPQSTLSDIVARAMVGLMYERIGWPEEWAQKVSPILRPLPQGAYLVLQVHDELVFETESEQLVAPTIEAAQTVMEQPWRELNGLSLPAGIASGESWGECN
jgi:uracil-DNA glycosylase family 4